MCQPGPATAGVLPKIKAPKKPTTLPSRSLWGDTHTWSPSRSGSGHFRGGEGKAHPGQMRSPRRACKRMGTPQLDPLLLNADGTREPDQRVFLAKIGKAGTPGDP